MLFSLLSHCIYCVCELFAFLGRPWALQSQGHVLFISIPSIFLTWLGSEALNKDGHMLKLRSVLASLGVLFSNWLYLRVIFPIMRTQVVELS